MTKIYKVYTYFIPDGCKEIILGNRVYFDLQKAIEISISLHSSHIKDQSLVYVEERKRWRYKITKPDKSLTKYSYMIEEYNKVGEVDKVI